MATTLGPYPVFNNKFSINLKGRDTSTENFAIIKEMETFSVSVDGNVEEWTPMETEGWVRRMMTGKGFTIGLNGKRNPSDPGNAYVAGLAWKTGADVNSILKWDMPDGTVLTCDVVINVTAPGGGDSVNVDTLELELMSDGKPTITTT